MQYGAEPGAARLPLPPWLCICLQAYVEVRGEAYKDAGRGEPIGDGDDAVQAELVGGGVVRDKRGALDDIGNCGVEKHEGGGVGVQDVGLTPNTIKCAACST